MEECFSKLFRYTVLKWTKTIIKYANNNNAFAKRLNTKMKITLGCEVINAINLQMFIGIKAMEIYQFYHKKLVHRKLLPKHVNAAVCICLFEHITGDVEENYGSPEPVINHLAFLLNNHVMGSNLSKGFIIFTCNLIKTIPILSSEIVRSEIEISKILLPTNRLSKVLIKEMGENHTRVIISLLREVYSIPDNKHFHECFLTYFVNAIKFHGYKVFKRCPMIMSLILC